MKYLCPPIFFLLTVLSHLQASAQDQKRSMAIQVRETAGIRRFGYPVTAQISLPPKSIQTPNQARLVNADGKPIAAQMNALSSHSDGSIDRLEIDFNLSPGPLETTKLNLQFGPEVKNVEPRQGLTFKETDESYQVSAYTIRKDARPLISSVRYGREYLKPTGLDVVLWDGDEQYRLHSAERKWTVEKRGPFQVRLVCQGSYPSRGSAGDLPFKLQLEFVSSKSWVGIHHQLKPGVESDSKRAMGVVADFQLAGRLLWDMDVGYWLYGVLEANEQMTMSQSDLKWSCMFGKSGQEAPYALGTTQNPQMKGWGHFQESREDGNVVAFGSRGSKASDPAIWTLKNDGAFVWRQEISDSKNAATSAYFHFIPVPAQHTARTSPAAMMSPLEVTYPDS